MKFLNERNTKHPTIRFEFEIFKRKITFLDTEVHEKNNKSYTELYRKKNDRQTLIQNT